MKVRLSLQVIEQSLVADNRDHRASRASSTRHPSLRNPLSFYSSQTLDPPLLRLWRKTLKDVRLNYAFAVAYTRIWPMAGSVILASPVSKWPAYRYKKMSPSASVTRKSYQ